MEFKKSMIIIMLAVFLISIASVSASDVNDTAIASDQTTVEISKNEEIILNQDIEQTNNEEIKSISRRLNKIAFYNEFMSVKI